MKSTADQQLWTAIFRDPKTPPELKAEAARHLKIKDPANGSYTSELDDVIASYWGTRPSDDPEDPPRNAVAEKVRHAIVGLTLLGGYPDTVASDVEIVLDVFAVCKTEWMKDQCLRALSAAVHFHGDRLPAEIKSRIESVLQQSEEQTTKGS